MDDPASKEIGGLDVIVRAAVRETPDPPRPSSLQRLLRASYGSLAGKSMVGLALVGGIPLIVIGVLGSREEPADLVVAILGVLFLIFFLVVPALPARRASKALQRGVRAIAEVVQVELRAPGPGRTIDALTNGFASGMWRVFHPAGMYDTTFETDAAWATDLRVGSKVMVLVDPDRQRVGVHLGPADDGSRVPG